MGRRGRWAQQHPGIDVAGEGRRSDPAGSEHKCPPWPTRKGCANLFDGYLPLYGQHWYEYMYKGWMDAQDDLNAAENALQGPNWQPASVNQTQTLFMRIKDLAPARALLAVAPDTGGSCSPNDPAATARSYRSDSSSPSNGVPGGASSAAPNGSTRFALASFCSFFHSFSAKKES